MRIALLWVSLFVALAAATPASQPAPAPARHVILVSIDGLAAFHLRNRALDLPNIRALAAAGVQAESSETVFPSVTHPSHTTLITGVSPRQHGVVGNQVRDRRTGREFHITNLPRSESIRVPTLFDILHARGLRTAAFWWPETKDDPAIDDNVAEVFTAKGGAERSVVAPALLDELRRGGVPIDGFYTFFDDSFTHPAGDVALTQAAAYVFSRRQPALTALHLVIADKVQHEVGPAHYRAATALSTADHCVGLLRKAVDAAGLAERTAFVIAADHGFVTVQYDINVAPLLREPALEGHVRWHAWHWYVFAELLPTFEPARHMAALERVLTRLERTTGIARIIRPREFAALGYPDYDDNPYVPGHYIIAAEADTHLLIDPAKSDSGRQRLPRPYYGHGYLPDHPSMHPALVLSGSGIAKGRTIGHVRNLDVAPTIAALLGVELPGATGKVLRGVLE